MAYELHEEGAAGRCASAVKKSGRLAVAIIGVAVGVILLLIGNHAVEKSEADVDAITDNTVAARY